MIMCLNNHNQWRCIQTISRNASNENICISNRKKEKNKEIQKLNNKKYELDIR